MLARGGEASRKRVLFAASTGETRVVNISALTPFRKGLTPGRGGEGRVSGAHWENPAAMGYTDTGQPRWRCAGTSGARYWQLVTPAEQSRATSYSLTRGG